VYFVEQGIATVCHDLQLQNPDITDGAAMAGILAPEFRQLLVEHSKKLPFENP